MPLSPAYAFTPDTRRAGARALLRHSDGDTLVVEQPIRLVSCDTPEKAGYAGKAEVAQVKLDVCRERLHSGFYDELPVALREYLLAKLVPGAAQRHLTAGSDASAAFHAILERRL